MYRPQLTVVILALASLASAGWLDGWKRSALSPIQPRQSPPGEPGEKESPKRRNLPMATEAPKVRLRGREEVEVMVTRANAKECAEGLAETQEACIDGCGSDGDCVDDW